MARAQQRINRLGAQVMSEHRLGTAITQVVPHYVGQDDWMREQVVLGLTAAVDQGVLSMEELEKRSLLRRAEEYVPALHQIVEEEYTVPEKPDAAQPPRDTSRDGLTPLEANIIDLYTTTPTPVEALGRIGGGLNGLYRLLKERDVPKRSSLPGFTNVKVAGELRQVDGRWEWVPDDLAPPAKRGRPPSSERNLMARSEALLVRLEALQTEVEQYRAAPPPALPAAPVRGQQWRVSWQVVRSGEEVVAAKSMAEAAELVRQQVGEDIDITGAVRE